MKIPKYLGFLNFNFKNIQKIKNIENKGSCKIVYQEILEVGKGSISELMVYCLRFDPIYIYI